MKIKELIKFYPYKEVLLIMIGFLIGIIGFNLDMERLISINQEYKTLFSETKLKIAEVK